MSKHQSLHEIQLKLGELTQAASFREPSFGRDHIFYSVLNACADKVNINEKMAMYNRFYCYEKALYEARVRHYYMARYWVKYLDRQQDNFSELAGIGMTALYYPMVAFIDYVTKNYADALDKLNKSLDLFDDLKKKGVVDVIGAVMEQNLNKFRIYSSSGDYTKALEQARNLVLFITGASTDIQAPYFSHNILDMTRITVENDWEGIIHYFINSVLTKLMTFDNHVDKAVLAGFWQDIYNAGEWDKSPCKEIRLAGKMLFFYYSGQEELFLDCLSEHTGEFAVLPLRLQGMLLDKMAKTSPDYEDYLQLELTIKAYNDMLKKATEEATRESLAA